jgi:hypothetical protein
MSQAPVTSQHQRAPILLSEGQKPAAPLLGLLHNLDSTVCGCGTAKAATHGFCGFCHAALPADLKTQLFYNIGEAYQQWWAIAKKWLVDNTDRYNGSGASRAVNLRVLPEAK